MCKKNKTLLSALCVLLASISFGYAQDGKIKFAKRLPAVDGELYRQGTEASSSLTARAGSQLHGPGLVLYESSYDLGTNASMPRNIHNYGDGTMAIARMLAQGNIGSWPDRGTFFAVNDGSGWLLPMVKVEANRTGWGNISALSDGRAVIAAHAGLQVNVDALKNLSGWTSFV